MSSMKRWVYAAAVFALGLAGAGAARAEVDVASSPSSRIFDDAGFDAQGGKVIRAELKGLGDECAYSEFSREGPTEAEAARCQAAIAKLVRRGPAVIGPVLAVIDDENSGWDVRRRLYDILAQTKDERLIEPLIRAMARIATRKLSSRDYESEFIHETLLELTRAPMDARAPWVSAPLRSQRRQEIDRVVDWRLWLEENRGKAPAELAAARLEDERSHAADPSMERAFRAVVYLLQREPAEGLDAAKKLSARSDLPEEGQQELEWRIDQAKEAAAEAAKKARMAPAAKSKAKREPAAAPAKAPARPAAPAGTTLS